MSKSNTHFTIFNAILDVGALSKGRMDVMLSLLRHRNNDGLSFPGIALICRETKFTKKYVIQYLTSLVDDGYLTIIGNHGAGNNRVYEINVNRLLAQLEKEKPVVVAPQEVLTTGEDANQDVSTSGMSFVDEWEKNQEDYYSPPAPAETVNYFTENTAPVYQIVPPAPEELPEEEKEARQIEKLQEFIRSGNYQGARFYGRLKKIDGSLVEDLIKEVAMEEVRN